MESRQAKTIDRFIQRNGRLPSATDRLELAHFPRAPSNRRGLKGVSYGWFSTQFSTWVKGLDLGGAVPHQARHTLATNLLRAGANLTHVKRYRGRISEAMAEHYVPIANTDPALNAALEAVWVSGPGAAEPGVLLAGDEPLTRAEAEALAIDLTRRSTPAESGFCTFQPVVNGDACPLGSELPQLAGVQLRLRQIGLYGGAADGDYDREVESAVRSYQFTRVRSRLGAPAVGLENWMVLLPALSWTVTSLVTTA